SIRARRRRTGLAFGQGTGGTASTAQTDLKKTCSCLVPAQVRVVPKTTHTRSLIC
ncbi:hypothetical protein IW139_001265, partial [Coemansia sp. RSA 353]